jgi:hypothetical protein
MTKQEKYMAKARLPESVKLYRQIEVVAAKIDTRKRWLVGAKVAAKAAPKNTVAKDKAVTVLNGHVTALSELKSAHQNLKESFKTAKQAEKAAKSTKS